MSLALKIIQCIQVINQLNIIIKTKIKLYDETGELEVKIPVKCKENTKEKKGG